MTTAANRFTPQEWSIVAGAPLLAAMWVLADEGGGMRATLDVVGAYRAAAGDYDTELLRELLATSSADAMKRPHDRDAVRRDALASLRQARDIVERVGTVQERAEYQRFVLALAEAARRAAGRGRLLIRARATHTDSERDALRSTTAILRSIEGISMPLSRTREELEPDDGSDADSRRDQAPAEPSRANPVTRLQTLTGRYLTRHPPRLTVLKWLGWNNPGGSMNL